MTQELSEPQFIEMFSEESYLKVMNMTYENMRETPEFKNNKPVITSLMVFPIKTKEGDSYSLVVEANAKKIQTTYTSGIKMSAIDFGIARLWLSDEQMPDIALDRYNEYMKVKNEIKKQDDN